MTPAHRHIHAHTQVHMYVHTHTYMQRGNILEPEAYCVYFENRKYTIRNKARKLWTSTPEVVEHTSLL